MSRLHEAAVESLQQVRSIIVAVAKASGPSGNLYAASGIGPHVRHVADHFRALQAGMKSGTVNYDVRRRESALERRSDLARLEIESIISWLQTAIASEIPLSVESEISCSRTERVQFQSNTSRELLYLINHTVHHAAYASLLVRRHGVLADSDVGCAPATASYRRDNNAISAEPSSLHIAEPHRPQGGLVT